MMMERAGFALLRAVAPILVILSLTHAAKVDEQAGWKYANEMNAALLNAKHLVVQAVWNYETNITDYNEDKFNDAVENLTKLDKQYRTKATTYPWRKYTNATLKRMFRKFTDLDLLALSDDMYNTYTNATNILFGTFSRATICDYYNKTYCDLILDPDVNAIFEMSTNPDELKYAWTSWFKAAGAPSRKAFTSYVKANNEASKLNGFKSAAESWLDNYEMLNEDLFVTLWAKIKPLYQQLHAYVRYHLRKQYGEKLVTAKGPIPAHLLGDVFAKKWINLESSTMPYPKKTKPNITAALYAKNYTPVAIVKAADKFFVSLNFTALPKTFYQKSIIVDPKDDRFIISTPSSWDFNDGTDFRIRQFTELTEEFYETTHFQIAQVEYFIQYRQQPYIFRDQAGPGFSDAFGETIVFSITSSKHYKALGFIKSGNDDAKATVNHLYSKSLNKISVMPFAYLLDLFRYGVFRGITTADDYNCHFWQLRESIQGIEPPVKRTEKDFDPGAIYQVAGDLEYMSQYLSNILQFQLHDSLCKLAGQDNSNNSTLSNCDIFRSTAAQNALKKALSMGTSQPWVDALEAITGSKILDGSGLLHYFQPLYDWLKAENNKNGAYVGWESSNITFCTPEQRTRMKSSGFSDILKKYSGN